MSRARTLAIAFLVLSIINALVAAPVLLSTHDHRPPTLIPVLIIICALASLAAILGLRQRASWAVPLGIGSRAIDVLGAIPAFFVGVGSGPLAGAAVSILISLVTIAFLVSVNREQALTTSAPGVRT